MAITYLSGGRIQGSSTGSASPTVAKTIFQGAGLESKWVDNSEDISYNATTDVIDFVVSGSGNTDSYATFDLQDSTALNGSSASDTAWILRFKLDITTYTLNHNSSSALVIGISNQGTSNGSASQNGIGFEVGVGNNDTLYRLQTSNSAAWARGSADAVFSETPAVETTYVEVKRTSATDVTVSMYSDSAYSTLLEAETITNVSGTTGLRYLSVKSDTQSEDNLLAGTVSEFELWNAVTSPTQDDKSTITDVPVGTRFEETDTRKIFRRKGAAQSVEGLKAYFTMGEASGDLINRAAEYGSTDAIANFDLSVTGATQNVNGKYNKCVSFSGNQWAEASDSNLTDTNFLSQNGAAWTICYWTAVEGLASGGNIEGDQGWFSTRGNGASGVFVRVAATVAPPNNMAHTSMVIGTNGTDKFSGNTTANGLEDLSSPTGWHFVVVQYNDATNTGRDMKDNSGTWNNITYEQGPPNLTNTDTPSAKFRLAQTASDNNRLNGDMEAVSIWNRILTAAELTSLYTSTEVGQGLAPSWVEKGTA